MTYLGSGLVDLNKVSAALTKAGLPDETFGIKTTTLLGWGAVATVGLVTFIAVRKFARRKRK